MATDGIGLIGIERRGPRGLPALRLVVLLAVTRFFQGLAEEATEPLEGEEGVEEGKAEGNGYAGGIGFSAVEALDTPL